MGKERNNRKKKEKPEIAYQNKDIISKVFAEEFKGKSFAVYGVNLPEISETEPTELPAVEANELRMDKLFHLQDGSYLLVDYESSYDEQNKLKYLGYIVRVMKKLYNRLRKYPRIRMLVIYTADVQKGSTNPIIECGCMRFTLQEAFLSDLDHEEIWRRVSGKVSQRKPE